MMNIPPSEAKRLSWWEYQALMVVWNERHDPEGRNEPAEPPEADYVAKRQQRLIDMGLVKAPE